MPDRVVGLRKQYRDIHVKMGYKKVDSSKGPAVKMGETYVPDELSGNHWGEVNQYYAEKYR